MKTFDATLVRVHTDEGVTGVGSGDTMDGFAAFRHLFRGSLWRDADGNLAVPGLGVVLDEDAVDRARRPFNPDPSTVRRL